MQNFANIIYSCSLSCAAHVAVRKVEQAPRQWKAQTGLVWVLPEADWTLSLMRVLHLLAP